MKGRFRQAKERVRLTDKKRTAPTPDEKLAATLLALVRYDFGQAAFVPVIDREWAKGQTARGIISRFEFDHYPVAVALGGTNHPTNLVPMIKADHREKTAKKDAKMLAKTRRLVKIYQSKNVTVSYDPKTLSGEDAARLGAAFGVTQPKKKKKWPKQIVQGSRASGWKKPLHGPAVKREKEKI